MWKPSCNSVFDNHDNTYYFKLKKGVPGGCPPDTWKHPLGAYEFKERCEVKSKFLEKGKYTWSADIETIADELIHAEVFHFFQVHDGRMHGESPSNCKVQNGHISLKESPTGIKFESKKFNLRCDIFVDSKLCVFCDYFLDGKHIGNTTSTNDEQQKPFMKFGAYRWNAVCDVEQIYRNVNLTYVS